MEMKYYGSEYGGFWVDDSLFGKRDNNYVLSFGIGEDLSFSERLLDNHNIEIFAFDPTPKAIKYVKNSKLYWNKEFHFYDIALADTDGILDFHLPTNEAFVSGSICKYDGVKNDGIIVKALSLNTIIHNLKLDRISILKMDIEGSEFDVFDSLDSEDYIFDQLCIEFHSRFFENGEKKKRSVIEKIINEGYVVCAESEELEEYTFVKKIWLVKFNLILKYYYKA